MSVNTDVCLVLDESNAIQIFIGYINKFENIYPRAIELLIGILVNMCSLSSSICYKLSINYTFIQFLILNIIGTIKDVPCVIQAINLLNIFLLNSSDERKDSVENGVDRNSIKKSFINFLKTEMTCDTNTDIMVSETYQKIVEKFYFILENSLNSALIDCTTLFIFNIIDGDDQILNIFATNPRFIASLSNATLTRLDLDQISNNYYKHSDFNTASTANTRCDSSAQSCVEQTPRTENHNSITSDSDISSIDHLFNRFFILFQTVSTCEAGTICLNDKAKSVVKIFAVYLEKMYKAFNDWEAGDMLTLKNDIDDVSIQNLICLISVLNCILFSSNNNNEMICYCREEYSTFFDKLFGLCKYYLTLYAKYRENTLNCSNCLKETEATNQNDTSITENNVKNFQIAIAQIKDFLNDFKNDSNSIKNFDEIKTLISLLT
jgi:hypothetical protein